MTNRINTLPALIFSPFQLIARPSSTKAKVLAVVLGTFFLAIASRIEVPMIPVPMNMQSFVVVTLGALYGWRLGTVTVLLWLFEGAIGLPVFSFSNLAAGYLRFVGPTGGYLFAFPIMAAFIGWLTDKGWTNGKVIRSFTAMLIAHAMCLTLGAAWLATMIGSQKALLVGVIPFLFSAILKSALATTTVAVVHTIRRSRRFYCTATQAEQAKSNG